MEKEYVYLKLLGKHLGLILNFNVPLMRDGIQPLPSSLCELRRDKCGGDRNRNRKTVRQ